MVVMWSGIHEIITKGESTVRARATLSCREVSFLRFQSITRTDCCLTRAVPIISGWERALESSFTCGICLWNWVRHQGNDPSLLPQGFLSPWIHFRIKYEGNRSRTSSQFPWFFTRSLIRRNPQPVVGTALTNTELVLSMPQTSSSWGLYLY